MLTSDHNADLDRYPEINPGHYPKVSVLIATFNRRNALEETLNRVAALRYPNIEILVVDDKSTDGTAEMLRTRPEITTIALKENVGSCSEQEHRPIYRNRRFHIKSR